MAKTDKVDVCIIGSGAGGSVAAYELGKYGASVVVLEAGKRFNPLHDYSISTSQEWERLGNKHRNRFSQPKMDAVTMGSKNIARPLEAFGVGGGTLRYLGHSIRMLPHDFKIRTNDAVGSDWPITYDDLSPHYKEVETELGVSGKGGDPWFPDIDGYPNPPFEFAYNSKVLEKGFNALGIKLWPTPVARVSRPFDGRPSCVKCGRCEYGCLRMSKSSADVTYIAKAEATGNVRIQPESIALRINIDNAGKAKSVSYVDADGIEKRQEAKVIILSTGTIQTPRLLLNSKSSLFPDGLANTSGMVGKNYMIHLYVKSSAQLKQRVDSFRGFAGSTSLDYTDTDRNNSFARGFSIKPKNILLGPVTTALNTPGWGAQHKKRLRDSFGHTIGLRSLGENIPSKHNYVALDSDKVDSFGMPLPKLYFKYSENDLNMMDTIESKMREIYSAVNASKIVIDKSKIMRSAHNVGTCRMGDRPETSAVNSYCQSHDVHNLFIVDASCFVTSGTSNPALTVQAIAKRASKYIINQGKKGAL